MPYRLYVRRSRHIITSIMIISSLVLRRLANQRINGDRFERPAEVVRWMGAMQAQDYAQAVWAVGLRTASAALSDVEQAIADKKIVRTWPMRGTLHFVPPEDAQWMLQLSAARTLARSRRRHEQLGLDQAVLERGRQLFYDALRGGGCLSRADMMALLENAGIPAGNQRGYHMLGYAALTGLICMGPLREKQQTFVLLDEWAPHARELPREEALAELARRYFSSRGPAALRDFAWWAGLPLGDARTGLAAAGPMLVSQTIQGEEYWQARESAAPDGDQAGDFHLLPGFDEYLLGYTDRGAVLSRQNAQKIVPGNNGVFKPMVVVDGQIVGAWKRILKKKAVEIVLSPFWQIALPEASVLEAARQYSDFLGLSLSTASVEAI